MSRIQSFPARTILYGAELKSFLWKYSRALPVMAYRCNEFAYATDLSEIQQPTRVDLMQGLDVSFRLAAFQKNHPTHSGGPKARVVEKIKKRASYAHRHEGSTRAIQPG